MKVVSKIYRPDRAMSEYLKQFKTISYDELIFITDWKGGKVYEAVNEWIRKYQPAIGHTPILWQKGEEIAPIEFRSKEWELIVSKWARENGLPEDFDDYDEVFVHMD